MADPEYVARLVDAFTALMRKEQRVELGFSEMARRFEEAAGGEVTPQVMGRWLKGHEQPREPKRRVAFARILGVSVGWLFYEEGEREPTRPPVQQGPDTPSAQELAEFVNGELDAAREERARADAASKTVGGTRGRGQQR